MRQIRFRWALGVGAVLGVAAVSSVFWLVRADPALSVSELVRVEALDDGESTALDDQMRWTFHVLGDRLPITEADISERFTATFAAIVTAEEITEGLGILYESHGAVTFVRFDGRSGDVGSALGVGEDGVPVLTGTAVDEQGRIAGWALDVKPSPPRLSGWLAALVLMGGSLFIAVGAGAYRAGTERAAWVLSLAGVLTLSTVLILSSSSLVYTIGRVAPAFAIVFAVWLLIGPVRGRPRAIAVSAAVMAAAIGVVAPLTRDATLIGHPDVLASFADNADVYRGLLAGSSFLAGGTLAVVVVVTWRQLRTGSGWRQPAEWAALGVAASWGAAWFGSSLDYGIGDGSWAGGSLNVAMLVGLAAVPGVVSFRQLASTWSRPELAGLVIELESGGGELRPAVARALEDPAVQVLISPDGEDLRDENGEVVTAEDVSRGRTLTQIRSGGRLVGGLVHDAALRQHSDRLRAVVAAVGLALEVGRLSQELAAQLQEVQASRRRIIEASDAARRRIERDLHDGAQQRLVALGLDLQRAKRLAEANGHHDFAALFDSATGEVRGTLDDIRSVSRGSQPPLLVERGLRAAVDALAERSPVPVRTNVAPGRLPAAVEIIAYYVVAEGLTNVAKHASGATGVSVVVKNQKGATRVEVRDDGCGGAAILAGSGLEGLDDRVAAAGGTFTVQSGPAGTTLAAVVPCA